MIDSHCHILPDIDDGPRNIDESIEMARIASEDGINKIIATPHISDNRFSPDDISDRVDQLNNLLKQKGIPVQVYPGAEVAVSLDPEKLSEYTINHTPYILIEFPHDHLPSYAGKMLDWLCAKKLYPIIAHPERNYSIMRSPEALFSLLNSNVYIQITADSLTGGFGRDIQYCAHFLLDSGKVDIIASDAHSINFRLPQLSAAAKIAAKRLDKKASLRLTNENPAAVLKGEAIYSNRK